jgi:DNA polymerase-3 subunit gamma/tau
MSYVVLARKYRPRNFTEMVGQGHVVQALTNALTTQRLHHAYLFTGTRGVGKTTFSRILAKSLNCLGADGHGDITAEPCGVCQACTDIDAGRFVDYTELDAASNRGVEDVQSLLEQAVYKPVQGRFKVFMIDEVHMLSGHAFNAMLKTLEEPPEYLKFVLATTDPQKVPVTVLSRCLQFNLRPMPPDTVLQHLQQVLQAEGVAAEVGALRLIARGARGSMRDALSLTDQAIAFGGGQLQEDTVRHMLGAVDRSHVFRLIEALAHADGASVLNTIDALRLNGLSAAATLEDMGTVLQRMAVVQAVPERAHDADPSDPDAPQVAALAQAMPPDETQLLYSLCLHGRAELGLAPDEYAALTMVLLRLLAFKPTEKKSLKTAPAPTEAPAGSLLVAAPVVAAQRPTPLPTPVPAPQPKPLPQVQPAPAVAPAPAVVAIAVREQGEPSERDRPQPYVPEMSPAPSDSAPSVQTPEGDFWFDTISALLAAEAITAMTRELALQAQLVAKDEAQWVLRLERESLNQPNTRDRLTVALNNAGHAVNLVVEVGPVVDTPARRLLAAQAERQRQAEDTIMADPFVQTLMRDYGGKIVPGSLQPMDV